MKTDVYDLPSRFRESTAPDFYIHEGCIPFTEWQEWNDVDGSESTSEELFLQKMEEFDR